MKHQNTLKVVNFYVKFLEILVVVGGNSSCRYTDKLTKLHPTTGHKIYLKILQLSKMYGEQQIAMALKSAIEQKKTITIELLKQIIEVPQKIPLVKINQISLAKYDQLHDFKFRKKEITS